MIQRKHFVFKFIKPIFIMVLLTIYFYLVARPSINKYIEGGVITKDGTPNSSYYPPSPAATICGLRENSGYKLLLN